VYNNEEGLPRVLENVDKLNEIFDLNVIAFYDKSQDKSLNILGEYRKKNKRVDMIINDKEKTSSRTKNIAIARNALLDEIRQKYLNCEYFIMMDSNEYSCVGKIKINEIKDVMARTDEWDSISFDRISGYYDTWALSFDPHIYSFFHFVNCRQVVAKMREDFSELLERYKRSERDMIPVYSAFNGFAIYKTSKFIDCSYSDNIDIRLFPHNSIKTQIITTKNNIIKKFNGDCEHRHFHLEAIAKHQAKIMISTKHIFEKVPNPRPGLRGPC
jgi:hypothetical protein